jgi:DNA replication protein DnaC
MERLAAELAARQAIQESLGARQMTEHERQSFKEKSKEDSIREAIRRANFPASAKVRVPNAAWDETLAYVEAGLLKPSIFAFGGPPGRGKTEMAYWCALSVLRQQEGFKPQYETASWLFARIRSTNQSAAKETEFEVLNGYLFPTILVIDEIGMAKGTDFEYTSLNTLLCRRYDMGKRTIVISARESFDGTFDPAVLSRMNQSGGIIPFDWGSFRK